MSEGVVQDKLLVITQLTASPLAKVLLLNVVPFVPALLPFSSHWYTGKLPPLAGVAVKVTCVPAQTLFMEADITKEAVTTGLTIAVTDTVWLTAPGEESSTLAVVVPSGNEAADRT